MIEPLGRTGPCPCGSGRKLKLLRAPGRRAGPPRRPRSRHGGG
ncbi:MAG: SEC-C domain-containing protein [Gemmatimonadetes bacterium]|nr:SEC-C domain-containing protein [Gemmatimonadota bacterium]